MRVYSLKVNPANATARTEKNNPTAATVSTEVSEVSLSTLASVFLDIGRTGTSRASTCSAMSRLHIIAARTMDALESVECVIAHASS